MTKATDPFSSRATFDSPLGRRTIHRLDALAKADGVSPAALAHMPYSIKVLLEACLRNLDGFVVTADHVRALANYDAKAVGSAEIPFMPGRVVLQDFTGVPAVVDLAAMRDAMADLGGDPKKVTPLVPCDLVIDHSVQVDAFARRDALAINSRFEFQRNGERYQFLKWGQQAFDSLRVVPPATGIIHQVNLEYLARVVWDDGRSLYPDSLVGTDSHTTMINGLGVAGWGVGGIEAEAVMLGQPVYMLTPEVVGFRLTGRLAPGCTATDAVLTVTQRLRRRGVVGKFVEFFGPALADMPLATRATIANMAPEYGATMGFFPVDEQTTAYLRLTGRDEKLVATVEQYCRTQGLWRDDAREVRYSDLIELDLGDVEPSLAGPKRPQDRVALAAMKSQWRKDLAAVFARPEPAAEAAGHAAKSAASSAGGPAAEVELDGERFTLRDGAVVIASITSCTNTSNPDVMIAAGLVARKAVALGLSRKPWVKTSLAPGSKVVSEYLDKAGLTGPLEALGFHLVGYGCATCIGNSGPLPGPISQAVNAHDLVAASVLSGNRNFEGRISPDVKANYLASPPLVVAYALAGTVDLDLATEPLGTDQAGRPVRLKDIWPTQQEVADVVAACVTREQFVAQYADVFAGSADWKAVNAPGGERYRWDESSTYIQAPPFFERMARQPGTIRPVRAARCLAWLGDSVTTDHISPAGAIKADGPAGRYLVEHGVAPADFNSYGSRRGNDRVMTRGTFANIRVRNKLAPGTEGGVTTDFADGQVKPIYDAAMNYKAADTPLVVLAGADYGMGSSRDWAAKGTFLLGVRAVIARSFERIHRSNLVGMGVLPLCFADGQSAESLGLAGDETFDIDLDDSVQPGDRLRVVATAPGGKRTEFAVACRLDTPVEVEYYRHGGILNYVLRRMRGQMTNDE